jgi:putative ABC transport system permease protein
VIVNQRLAEVAWPGEDPIGKRIPGSAKAELEVVGVVGNSNYLSVRETTRPILYSSFDQAPGFGGTLHVRCRRDLRGVGRAVRQIVESTAPAYQVSNVSSLEVLRDGIISRDRLLTFLSSLFAALGTALALAGIYGLISYSVTQRTHEVGIRVSVGAQRGEVLRLFLYESALLAATGMALGLPLALALARLIRAMLYNVSPAEPVDIAITLVCLGIGSMAAAYFPGRRATRIDPVKALRYD